MARILVTGATGQLGAALIDWIPFLGADYALMPTVHKPGGPSDFEVMPIQDPGAVAKTVAKMRPDWIVNAAAKTDVDACERDPESAWLVNALGPRNLATVGAEQGARLVHVSTDYVFSGSRGRYAESDETDPINAYGASKLEGERLVLEAAPDPLIARTSVVFGPHKKNFVTWVVDELTAGRPIRIVEDQWVSPTYAGDLAEQILALIEADAKGVYHTAGADRLSRVDMAHAIADQFDVDESLIQPITSSQMNWLARRPRDSSLDVNKVSPIKRPLKFKEALAAFKEARDA